MIIISALDEAAYPRHCDNKANVPNFAQDESNLDMVKNIFVPAGDWTLVM